MAKRKASELSGKEVANCSDDSVVLADSERISDALVDRPTGWRSGEGITTKPTWTQGADVASTSGTKLVSKEGVAVTHNWDRGTGVTTPGKTKPDEREGVEATAGPTEDVSEGEGSDLNPFFRLLMEAVTNLVGR